MRTKSKGVALLTVVLIFFVLVILLAGVMNSTVINQKNATTTNTHTAVYYGAESGLQVQIAAIQELIDHTRNLDAGYTMANFTGNLATLVNSINGSNMTLNHLGNNINVQLQAYADPVAPDYTVVSTSTLNGVSRILKLHFRFEVIDGHMDLGRAIIAKSSISTSNNSVVQGPVASLIQPTSSTVKITNCGVTKIYVPVGMSSKVTKPTCVPAIVVEEGPLTPFSDVAIPVYPTVDTNYQLASISGGVMNLSTLNNGKIGFYIDNFNPSGDLTINLGNGASDRIVTLWVKNQLSSLGSGTITVTGNGKVKLLTDINNSSYISWDKNVNPTSTDPTKFMWYIRSSGTNKPTITFPNNAVFVGSIYANNANFELKKIKFIGFIVTGGTAVNVTANTTVDSQVWIYAPKASTLIKANSTLYGSVMTYDISLESGGGIIYKGLDFDLPFTEIDLPLVPQASEIIGNFGNIIEQ